MKCHRLLPYLIEKALNVFFSIISNNQLKYFEAVFFYKIFQKVLKALCKMF